MDLREYKPSEELLWGAPCRAFLRTSLGRARAQDVGLRGLATSPDRAEQHGAFGILETGAAAAPPKEPNPSLLGSPECELFAAPNRRGVPGFQINEGTPAHCGDLARCRTPSVAENPGAGDRASHF